MMLKLLESGRKYSISELADKIEVSERMIKIYKNELEKAGIYIDTIKGRYGGYVYHHKNNYDISFNYFDVDAIESVLSKLDEKEQQNISITLEKLRTIVIYQSDENRNMKVDKDELDKKYLRIAEAIKNKQELTFKFHNKVRVFEPHNFTFYKEYIYVTGFSKLENDLKTLNISGIKFID